MLTLLYIIFRPKDTKTAKTKGNIMLPKVYYMFVFQFYNKVIVRFYKRYDAFGLTDHFGYNYGFTQKIKSILHAPFPIKLG